MKKSILMTLAGVIALAGCATPQTSIRLNDLRTSDYLRTERSIPFDSFAKVQMALFKHHAACGGNIEFTANPNNASYAMVTKKSSPGADWGHTVLIELVLMQNTTVRARAYSYYANTDAQIEQMFNAMIHPTVCPK